MTMTTTFLDKHPCATARADRGQWLTEREHQTLTHWSRWGSTGYPVHKLGRGWTIDSPVAQGFGVFKTKREAVARWEEVIDILIDLKGIEAYNRHMAEREVRQTPSFKV
jgi:hypothetical protein